MTPRFFLFVFGLAIGSFLNVVSLRYDPEQFLFKKSALGGRSACPNCQNKLKWFELIPLLSFLFLRGRCKNCHAKISWQYPLVELASALIFVFVPHFLSNLPAIKLLNLSVVSRWPLVISYLLVFLTLLLVSLIDIRLRLIPDEANLLLVLIGFALIFLLPPNPGGSLFSFSGSFALLFGLQNNIWLNRLLAVLFGIVFYGLLIFITRGRGMGLGDLKLTAALGVVFGWPDILLLTAFSFIIGSLFSLPSLVRKKRGLKSFLPFGPFIALGAVTVFFFAEDLMRLYFSFFHG
ncbi:MAG: prepilin peptidase [Candidatus Liptonbacteria bacterium]|nr:prepilin peptidase [Candidatus Liptonbacteria bacterium]